MSRMILGLVLVSGLAAAPAAFAQDQGTQKVDVTFPTRQLRDPAEAKAVYARLYKAVQYVCQTDGGEGPLWRRADDQACEDEAMKGVLAQINQPQIQALYRPGAPQVVVAGKERRSH
ncbi:MAG: UrcA family protein [Asticcacaulis sp.]|uniref:UrcA family protein n=1 Tax=Asticcacaulis sp. TaxID=1872648 RepID=UPI0039E72254